MTVNRDDARAKVDTVFRPVRRTGAGTGGVGNPHETWNDLKAMVQTAFLLDTDSIFTVSAWTTSRMIAACSSLAAACQTMLGYAQGLLTEPKSIDDITELDEASSLLIQALTSIQTGHAATAASDKRQSAMAKLTSFVGNSLVPAVDPSLSGQDLRSPSESRRGLKQTLPVLLELMTVLDDAVTRMTALTADVPPGLPTRTAAGIVRDTRAKVNQIRRRLGEASPIDRAANAHDDLYELAASLTGLGLLDRTSTPVLERGGPYTCNAAGSGPGATMLSAFSAPYRLINTQTDTLRLAIDGGPVVPVDLPAAKQLVLDFSFPMQGSALNPYGVPPGPPAQLQLIVNGIRGAWVPVVGPTIDPVTLAALINATPGAIPVDPGLTAYLVVTAPPLSGGFFTVNIRYNAIGAVSPLTDLSAHIGIVGSTGLLGNFGFPGTQLVPDPSNPGYDIYRQFWRPAQQGETIQAIKDGFPGARVEPVNTTLLEGRSVYDPANPDRFVVFRYFGNGIWNPAAGLLTLGSDFRKVKVGDEVQVSTVSGVVTGITVDGVQVTLASPLVYGPYTVAIRPAGALGLVGKTLRVIDSTGFGVDHRITGAVVLPDGTIELQLSWNLYWAIFGPTTQTLDYQVNSDLILMGSKNTLGGSAFQVSAGANNAAPALGFPFSTVTGELLQINCPGADFVAAGVTPGDFVTLTALPDNYVDAVLDAENLRLVSPIPALFLAGTVHIFNRKYYEYNQLVATGLPVWTPPSQTDIEKATQECVRAAGAGEAAGRLTTLLASLSATTTSFQTALMTYRGTLPVVSPYMADVRNALEESGADRAADMLQSGRLAEMLSLSTDQASSARLVLQNLRKISRKLLGTSVYDAQPDRREAEALANPETIYLDNTPSAADIFGPPRSNA